MAHQRGNQHIWAELDDLQQKTRELERIIREYEATQEQLRMLAEAIQQTSDSILITTAELNLPGPQILFVNAAFTRITGYTPAEVVGKTPRILQGPKTDRAVLDRLRFNLEHGETFFGTTINYRKNGSEFDMEWRIAPIRNKNHEIVYFVSIQQDVSDRKAMERTLRESEERYRRLLHSIPNSVIVLDNEWRFQIVNVAATRMLGRSLEQLHNIMLSEICPSIVETELFHTCQTVLSTGQSAITTVELAFHPDQPAWYEVHTSPVPNGILCLFVDITARKRVEEEQYRLEDKLRQAQKLESLGVLAGGIAHDFNNLLTSVLGYADLALLDLSPFALARHNVEQIVLSARRAADLTRQLLAYSGKGRFIVEPVQLALVVEEMSHLLEVSIAKKCTLRFHFTPDIPAIQADVTQLRQVIMNLILNASEAIGEQNGVISITTGAMYCDRDYLAQTYFDQDLPDGIYVYLEVSDTGIGMPQDVHAKIFDPFFTTKLTGRGLGLAAVLGIVRGHGGAIKVYSEPGRGTTFKVLFPGVHQSDEMPQRPLQTGESWKGQGTVLVVDDEEAVRTIAQRMLERMGFIVYTATDGYDGVTLFQAHADEIHLVLLDMTMPRMDGEEVFRELRRLRPEVLVVLTSGYNEQDAINRFSGKGLAGFIQKPYQYEELRTMLHDVLASVPSESRENSNVSPWR